MSKLEFPDRFCPDLRKGQECRYGKDCRFSHDKKRFDADGKLKVKGAAKIRRPPGGHEACEIELLPLIPLRRGTKSLTPGGGVCVPMSNQSLCLYRSPL